MPMSPACRVNAYPVAATRAYGDAGVRELEEYRREAMASSASGRRRVRDADPSEADNSLQIP